jgi:hypothetical protein
VCPSRIALALLHQPASLVVRVEDEAPRWSTPRGSTISRRTSAQVHHWVGIDVALGQTGPKVLSGVCTEYPTFERGRLSAVWFVLWAAQHGYCPADLDVPYQESSDTRPTMDDQQRMALATRLLHDSALDASDRLAGCLVLLFGQITTHIARLQIDDMLIIDGSVALRLGRSPLRLREPLASLVVALIGQARAAGRPWLFPGMYQRPMSTDRLRARLRAIGLRPALARNGARAALAADLPPALLADKLGLSITAAVRIHTIAGASWKWIRTRASSWPPSARSSGSRTSDTPAPIVMPQKCQHAHYRRR